MKKKSLLQINFKNRIVVITAISVVIIFLLVYFVIIPAISNLREVRVNINDKKIDLEAKSFQTGDIKKYFEEKKEVEDRLADLDSILLNQKNSFNFTNDLESIATQNNIDYKINLFQNKSEEIGRYHRVPIAFTLEGDLSDLIKYLVDLETLKYYINIDSLELSFQILSPEEKTMVMRLSANTFWEK